jgi:hypothetical protein
LIGQDTSRLEKRAAGRTQVVVHRQLEPKLTTHDTMK